MQNYVTFCRASHMMYRRGWLRMSWNPLNYRSSFCGSYTLQPFSHFINEPCEGQIVQLYKAYTRCLPTITLQKIANETMCPYQLIIVQAYQTTKIEITPETEFLATFDCVKEINVKCGSSPLGICFASLNISIAGCLDCCC